MKLIVGTIAALSLAIAGAGVAEKGLDRAAGPMRCGFACPGNCGIDCPGDCSPKSCEGCGNRAEAKSNGTDAAQANLTKFTSLSTESDGEGTCPGQCGLDCPGDCGIDCPGDCESCPGRMWRPKGCRPANGFFGGCGGHRGGCFNVHAEPTATEKTETATSSTVADVANVQ